MTPTRSGSAASYAAVAVAAAVVSALGTWSATQFVATSVAQPAAAGPGQLLTQPLADLPGREVRISLLDRDPGSSSARHRHPGHHTFGYVVEGTYEFGINGQPARTLNAGDTFYEPPTAVHSTSRNPSTDKRAKILVFMVADQKNPSTVPNKVRTPQFAGDQAMSPTEVSARGSRRAPRSSHTPRIEPRSRELSEFLHVTSAVKHEEKRHG